MKIIVLFACVAGCASGETAGEIAAALALDETAPDLGETDPTVGETVPTVDETDPAVDKTDPAVDETDPAVDETDPAVDKTDPGVDEAAAVGETAVTPSPQNPSPVNAVLPNTTSNVRLSWSPVTNAHYAVRVIDQTDGTLHDPHNNCTNNTVYVCRNGLTTTHYDVPVQPGHSYWWWVHAVRPGNTSPATSAQFVVSATSPVGFDRLGSATVVQSSNPSCPPNVFDVPDGSANAFRDAAGRVNLITPSEINWRRVGTTLDNVQKECAPVLSSIRDPIYDHFENNEWLSGTYTEDGNTIYGLIHDEWYAYLSDSRCPNGTNRALGWVNAITAARSDDGGANFYRPADRIVSRSPVAWINGDARFTCTQAQPTIFGSFGPSNILKVGSFYYAMYQSERDPLNYLPSAACLMRTSDLAAASAWEKWTAAGWDARPDAVCSPIDTPQLEKMHESINYDTYLDRFILVGLRFSPDAGVYLSVSSDLFHWSPPVQIYHSTNNDHVYPAILDPADTTRNFERPGAQPFIYFTSLPTWGLYRQPLKLMQDQPSNALHVPAGATAARSANWSTGQTVHTLYGLEWLEYELQVPATATWQAGLTGRNYAMQSLPPGYNFLVEVYVDGQYRATITLPGDRVVDRTASVGVSLSKGVHRIRYRWINDAYSPGLYDANLQVTEVSLTR